MRWRPPTRPLILIALLLLGGAVVNVAVAWGIVMARDEDELVFSSGFLRAYDRWPPSVDPDWPAPARNTRLAGFGITLDQIRADDPDDRAFGLDCLRVGWPLKSAVVTFTVHQREAGSSAIDMAPAPGAAGGIAWPGNVQGSQRWPRRLPLAPIATGFVINTLFYAVVLAAILALPLSFFPIRRRLRARRGRCPKCRYDLAGLGGAAGGGPPLRGGRGAD